jgi:hypothetical protein
VFGFSPTTRFHHAEGTNAAFVEGYVRFIKGGLPAAERREMIAISGGERKTRGDEDSTQHPGKAD